MKLTNLNFQFSGNNGFIIPCQNLHIIMVRMHGSKRMLLFLISSVSLISLLALSRCGGFIVENELFNDEGGLFLKKKIFIK
jgi:hypothetical protein